MKIELNTPALLFPMISMLMIFEGWQDAGHALFFLALVSMVVSLAISLWEIQLSTSALNVQLELLALSGP